MFRASSRGDTSVPQARSAAAHCGNSPAKHASIMAREERKTRALYPTSDIRAIEQHYLSGPSPQPLMERAGLACAELARELLGDQGTSVLVFAGPGNNGG